MGTVDISDEAQTERKRLKQLYAVVDCGNVVGHLFYVVERDTRNRSILMQEEIGER